MPAGHNSRLACARNLTFTMEAALNTTIKKSCQINDGCYGYLMTSSQMSISRKISTFLGRAISLEGIEIFQFCFDFLKVRRKPFHS